MEALPWPARDSPGPIRDIPPAGDGYLGQPDMRRLIATALELGWSCGPMRPRSMYLGY